MCYNMSVKKRGTKKMGDKRFKQVRNYFYSIYEHERSKLLSLYNECLSLMRFRCLLYMNVLNDEGGY